MSLTERLDAITDIPEDYRVETPPCPRSVKIELTARCNFACAFCARGDVLRDQRDMDKDLFKRLVREMREEGVEELGLFYLGESFLLPWLEEAIRFAKQDCGYPYVFLTTNGSLSNPARMDACMEAGLDSLKFSLNYADEDQFKDIARVKPKLFQAMLGNIKASREIRDRVEAETGHRCGLYASYILYDGEQGQRMDARVRELSEYLDEIYQLPLYTQASLVTDEEQARGWDATPGNRGRVGALREPLPCWAVFTEGHISYDGKLSACCFDHAEQFHMGDLNEQAFMDAWQGADFAALRRAHLAKDVTGTACERCVAIC